jgi:hypothetical protein
MDELRLTCDIAEQFLGHQDEVCLNEFTSLDDDAAERLGDFHGQLDLDGLASLSDRAAESLSKHRGGLFLDGLTRLSASAAESLGAHCGDILLNGLTSLTGVAAENFGKHKIIVPFDGRSMNEHRAELNAWSRWLSLNGLTSLSEEVAEGLSRFDGGVRLDGLADLADDIAEILSTYKRLSLRGLTDLSCSPVDIALAEVLSVSCWYDLSLDCLTKLPDEIAVIFGQRGGSSISLNGLTSLSDVAAENLSMCFGVRSFGGLTQLSDMTAEILTQFQGLLCLDGLVELTDGTAEILSTHWGGLSLRGLTNLPDDSPGHLALAQRLISDCPYWEALQLDGLTSISDTMAETLSQCDGDLDLSGLTSLSDVAAVHLSKHEGQLKLNGLTSLSDKAAIFLSMHYCDLYLDGLTSLTDTTAAALSNDLGSLSLNGLLDLSDAAAWHLSGHQGSLCSGRFGNNLSLRVSSLTGSAAEILAQRVHRCWMLFLPEWQDLDECMAFLRETRQDWIAFEINRQIGICTPKPSSVIEDREEILAAVFLKLSEILKHDRARNVMTSSDLELLLDVVIRMTLSKRRLTPSPNPSLGVQPARSEPRPRPSLAA